MFRPPLRAGFSEALTETAGIWSNIHSLNHQSFRKEKHMAKAKSKAVTIAARSAGDVLARFGAVESEACRIHQEQSGAKLVRALLKDGKMHAVITDGKSPLEVMDGAAGRAGEPLEAPRIPR